MNWYKYSSNKNVESGFIIQTIFIVFIVLGLAVMMGYTPSALHKKFILPEIEKSQEATDAAVDFKAQATERERQYNGMLEDM